MLTEPSDAGGTRRIKVTERLYGQTINRQEMKGVTYNVTKLLSS